MFRCKWTDLEEDIDIGFTSGDSSTPEKPESAKHVLTPSNVDIEPNSKRLYYLYTTPY
jgi:hypothetical protein